MEIKFTFDETNVQVGFENQFKIKDLTDKTLVKLLMLKGEKGDNGGATKTSELINDSGFIDKNVNNLNNYTNNTSLNVALGNKQDNLVSGTNIKTINNESILGSGNISINGGSSSIIYSTSEQLIGEWIDGLPLYRKTLIFNYSDLTITNNRIDIDITSLGAYEVFIDEPHSYFYENIIYDGVDYRTHRPIQFIRFPNITNISNFKKESLAMLDTDQEMLSIWIGDSVNWEKIILTFEYTKASTP